MIAAAAASSMDPEEEDKRLALLSALLDDPDALQDLLEDGTMPYIAPAQPVKGRTATVKGVAWRFVRKTGDSKTVSEAHATCMHATAPRMHAPPSAPAPPTGPATLLRTHVHTHAPAGPAPAAAAA